MHWSALLTADGLLSLATLAAMEIVLGIDNVVFLSIITAKLPPQQQPSARKLGLALALLSRLGLLFGISWVMGLTEPLFEVFGKSFSGRDLILLGGGAFLITKATREIHGKVEADGHDANQPGAKRASYGFALLQIAALDVIFSLDSVITAVGMVDDLAVMVVAMCIAMVVMLAFAAPIGGFVERHPTMKVLALAFLILIGVMLVVDGTGHHVPKGYIYFAMAFSLAVELVNMRVRKSGASKTKQAPAPTP
jgi:predicted tellurium resistance membrane protein TerC